MRAQRRSQTAEAAAAARALHQYVDDEPKVLEDRLAGPLLGLRPSPLYLRGRVLRRQLERRVQRRFRLLPFAPRRPPIGTRRLRAQLVTRSRYAEDQLLAAIAGGVDQYVILAAGLDTFALRRTDLEGQLKIFEVDHPATQEWKLRRLRAAGLAQPAHLELVPIDFESQTLTDALAASGYDAERPAFFSWLGVTYYLTRSAITATLSFVGEQATGSELVFDYWKAVFLRRWPDRALLDLVRFSVSAQGEPMLSFFEPTAIAELAEERGLVVLESLDAAATQSRYLSRRRDGLVVPEFAHLCRLGVAAPS